MFGLDVKDLEKRLEVAVAKAVSKSMTSEEFVVRLTAAQIYAAHVAADRKGLSDMEAKMDSSIEEAILLNMKVKQRLK